MSESTTSDTKPKQAAVRRPVSLPKQLFTFTRHGVVIESTSLEGATRQLKKQLKTREAGDGNS